MQSIKKTQLSQSANQRRNLFKNPKLRFLFLELTKNCNERCLHCGSDCGNQIVRDELSTEDFISILDQIKEDFGTKGFMLCITGGEPLLRKDFFTIMNHANELGFSWGMTSNGTLITPEIAHNLKLAGMRTISVSIDGPERYHDMFRQTPYGYERAMNGIRNLINEGGFEDISVTTVLTHESLPMVDELFNELDKIDIDGWRLVNLEPMGRAKKYPELLFTPDDYKTLFSYITDKRKNNFPVSYGCCHYLGIELEGETRDWYYFCNAGLCTASITSTGDIVACLDIESRPELIQGNIHTDRFKTVWDNRLSQHRDENYRKCSHCKNCTEWDFCMGDSFHSWNFDENKPDVCLKGILF